MRILAGCRRLPVFRGEVPSRSPVPTLRGVPMHAPLIALLGLFSSAPIAEPPLRVPALVSVLAVGSSVLADWVADSGDNVCGLSDVRALSDPAKVDYEKLWDATPEIKKMKKDGIDPSSAEGIQLKEKATDRIREACKQVMEDKGHCSVWKKIRHTDGRKIADITEQVQKKFPADLP
jgi:hypothetical protein